MQSMMARGQASKNAVVGAKGGVRELHGTHRREVYRADGLGAGAVGLDLEIRTKKNKNNNKKNNNKTRIKYDTMNKYEIINTKRCLNMNKF